MSNLTLAPPYAALSIGGLVAAAVFPFPTIATITPAQFRVNFPAFADGKRYPGGQIAFWLNLAYLRLRTQPWADLLDTGVQLYVAHNLVLEARAQATAKKGGFPAEATGPMSARSVDKASVSYDTGASSIEGAGNYNLTTYGTRFMELVNIVGAQAIQIGTGPNGGQQILLGYPWVGYFPINPL